MLKIENKIYLSWSDVEDLVGVLCEKIATKIPNVTHISGLARGGLIPAVLVSHKLNLPYTDKILWSDDKVIRNDCGVIEGGDMLPGTAKVKLMWALANTDNPSESMQISLAGEITEPSRPWD